MKIILTGATGTAGAEVLRQALLVPSIQEIAVLSRRELPPHVLKEPHPKVNVVIHKDYAHYDSGLLKKLAGYDAAIWAQGKSSVGMKEDEYDVLTRQYPLAAAKAFSTGIERAGHPGAFVFCYVSGHGANQDGSSALFAKVKGRAEKELAELAESIPSLSVYSFRPGAIQAVSPTPEASTMQKVGNVIAPLFRPFGLDAPTDVLAKALLNVALKGSRGMDGWEGKGKPGNAGVFENKDLKPLAASLEK